MITPTLTAYSHYVKVTDFDDEGKQSLYKFIKERLTQYDINIDPFGRMTYNQKYFYATSNATRTEFRFHINQLDELIQWLRRYGASLTKDDVIHAPPPEYEKAEFTLKTGWEPSEVQVSALEYIFGDNPNTKMLPMQTGTGKTATAFFAIQKAGMRTLLVIKPSLLKQWTNESYPKQLEYEKGDILSISGRKDLLSLIHLALDGAIKAKFIAISNVTLQRYITDWEADGDTDETPVAPDALFRLLRIGIMVQDEWHLFFHLNFKLDLYTHVVHNIKLSATVDQDDAFLDRMYNLASPKETRFAGMEYNKYVHVIAYQYSIDDANDLRITNRGRTSYSHKQFEWSILKRKQKLKKFLDMVSWLVQDDYVKPHKAGMKCIVFAERVEMCDAITEHLKRCWSDLTIIKKTGEDKKVDLHSADIIVSTLGSLGVGTDLDDVYYILMTNSISSQAANEQAKGRARVMKHFKGTNPVFAYLYSTDIKKQLQYHKKKLIDFQGKCLTHRVLVLPCRI